MDDKPIGFGLFFIFAGLFGFWSRGHGAFFFGYDSSLYFSKDKIFDSTELVIFLAS